MPDYNEIIRSLKAAASGVADMAKDFASTAGDKAKEVAGDASEKARAVARIAKLKIDIAAEKVNAKDAYAEVGRLFFDATDKKNVPEPYIRAFDSVMLANAAIERMEAELSELRTVVNEPEDAEDASFELIVNEAERAGSCCGDGAGSEESDITVEITVDEPEKDEPEDAPKE